MAEVYEPVIGLEVHVQLQTQSKMFCKCKNKYGDAPNIHTCPICLGYPGTLPVLNKKAVEFGIKAGLATNCEIADFCRFARKNYFYPDLPKGYQISQYKQPLCYSGKLMIESENGEKAIGITRIHLEEDSGKSIHGVESDEDTYLDFNRCGVPLIEIVSEPDIRSPEEAYQYLRKLKLTLEYLEISDCNMEQGSLRCDANISVRKKGEREFGIRTEMKNMNSFSGVKKALEFEIKRQSKLLEEGGKVVQQTLLWDDRREEARPMRGKEESEDYRYFPEPDLVALEVDQKWLHKIKEDIAELPDEKHKRFKKEYELRDYDIDLLISDHNIANYYENTVEISEAPVLTSKWLQNEVLRVLKEENINITDFAISEKRFGQLLILLKDDKINANSAKKVFNKMLQNDVSPAEIVEEEGLAQMSGSDQLAGIIEAVLEENSDEAARYREGEKKLFGFFMGQVMKKTKGKANPQETQEILRKLLDE
ncbi:MAG: Asp-tRNA(Asn)/Glu-tRNA(Gln) amidotransferase subunit GatB [Candidatus Marinimicrobia bacterium]|nr:Asp-tRNA(Asn)/Glu-tRNA(Gln) amidotransferase subunit GatB [Candidatus Neomarinimicrobiota bacterium]